MRGKKRKAERCSSEARRRKKRELPVVGAAAAVAKEEPTLCAVEFKNFVRVKVTSKGLVHEKHKGKAEKGADGEEEFWILTSRVLDKGVVNDGIEDKRDARANVKVKPIEPREAATGEELVRVEEEREVAPDSQVVAEKEQQRKRDHRKAVDDCVHGVDGADAVGAASEDGGSDEHPSGIELEDDGDEEVDEEDSAEEYGEEPNGQHVEEGVVPKHQRHKQQDVKGGLKRVVPISETVHMNGLLEDESGSDDESIDDEQAEEDLHRLIEAHGLGGKRSADERHSRRGGLGQQIGTPVKHAKRKAGRPPKNRNGKRVFADGSMATSSPKSLITMHCIYADCMNPLVRVWGYARYRDRYMKKHCKNAHGTDEALVCSFCGEVFSDYMQYDEHVGSRCLDNPKVVRRLVAQRGLSAQRNPYVRMKFSERTELLEEGLLQFPRTVVEEIILTGQDSAKGGRSAGGGAFLYNLEKQQVWLQDRKASILRHRQKRAQK